MIECFSATYVRWWGRGSKLSWKIKIFFWIFRIHPIWLKRNQQANLPVRCFGIVAPEELHDGEGDDPDGKKDGEEDPVELVEEPQIWSSLDNKSSFSEADEENSKIKTVWNVIWSDIQERPEEEVEEQRVEVDTAEDCSCKLGQLAPHLVAVGVPRSKIKSQLSKKSGDATDDFACKVDEKEQMWKPQEGKS